MNLYVDDMRRCPDGWELARTNADAIRILATKDVKKISIDHDICVYIRKQHILTTIEENFTPIVYYIVAMPKEKRPEIILHSANGWGRKTMFEILTKEAYKPEQITISPGSYLIQPEELSENEGENVT